jgi:hypothetical protein
MAKPTTPPPGVDHAAEQGVPHIPTALPPVETPPAPPEVSLPDATEHMSEVGIAHNQVPDWFVV